MKSQRSVISWMPRMGLCLVAGLLLLAGLVPGGILGAGEGADEGAPLRPVTMAPHPPGTGFIPPPVDLSHLTGQALPSGAEPEDLPAAYDWRDYGVVTPVKNQGTCGSCYAFGSLGSLESKLAIDGAGTWDLSENHAKECNWRERNDYEDPPGSPWGSCDGGNSWMIANLYSQTGSALESCNPYQATDVACSTACPYQQSVLDFRVISGSTVPSTALLKQYLYDNGPIITSMYADSGQGFDNSYTGAYTFNYSAPAGSANHCVLLVGWSNNLPPVPGGSTPADGWIVKNSWGTGWGDSGYFYMTYGAANIGYNSTFFHEWQSYDPNGDVWYYDEDGYNYSFGQSGGTNTTAWILAKYIPPSNTNVTRIEFWANDATTDVDGGEQRRRGVRGGQGHQCWLWLSDHGRRQRAAPDGRDLPQLYRKPGHVGRYAELWQRDGPGADEHERRARPHGDEYHAQQRREHGHGAHHQPGRQQLSAGRHGQADPVGPAGHPGQQRDGEPLADHVRF
jgi:C1A family cysteine protease